MKPGRNPKYKMAYEGKASHVDNVMLPANSLKLKSCVSNFLKRNNDQITSYNENRT